jgi:rhamnosyltransferase
MRVLAHIHTFNDADVIDRTIEAVRGQTRQVDGILVVDNASTDGTLDRLSLQDCAVVRHPENLGVAGTVHSGFCFALEHGYDWIWLFDADSLPAPDALEKLLNLYDGWPSNLQDEIGFLACLPCDTEGRVFFPGAVFTRRGLSWSKPVPETPYYLCQFTLWSGCLYRLAAVRQVGGPNPDYMLDWSDFEYAYRVMKAGYKSFMHRDAILHHDIRGFASLAPTQGEPGSATMRPIRCYYNCRNALYFPLYEFTGGLMAARLWMFVRMVLGVVILVLRLVARPRQHGAHLLACFRGIWHGLTGNIAARY